MNPYSIRPDKTMVHLPKEDLARFLGIQPVSLSAYKSPHGLVVRMGLGSSDLPYRSLWGAPLSSLAAHYLKDITSLHQRKDRFDATDPDVTHFIPKHVLEQAYRSENFPQIPDVGFPNVFKMKMVALTPDMLQTVREDTGLRMNITQAPDKTFIPHMPTARATRLVREFYKICTEKEMPETMQEKSSDTLSLEELENVGLTVEEKSPVGNTVTDEDVNQIPEDLKAFLRMVLIFADKPFIRSKALDLNDKYA